MLNPKVPIKKINTQTNHKPPFDSPITLKHFSVIHQHPKKPRKIPFELLKPYTIVALFSLCRALEQR